jgi:plastocyanin
MKGARALASGMLVLASVCILPAASAAQDTGTAAPTATTATTASAPPADQTGATASGATPMGTAVGAPGDPRVGSGATTVIGDSPPAGVPSGGAHEASSTGVTMGDFFFRASSITIHVGDTVTWHNSGQAPHTATANDGSFNTGTVNPGGSASHTFQTAGTFSYVCTIHPNMTGTIHVLSASGSGAHSGGGGGSASSSGSSSSSAPSEAQAVSSPNAAGNSSTLPMTGMAVGALVLVGIALLGGGLLARHAARAEARELR